MNEPLPGPGDPFDWLREHLRRLGLNHDDSEEKIRQHRQFLDQFQGDSRTTYQSVAHSMGLAFVDIERVLIDPADVAAIPAEVCRHHRIAPVKRDGQNLWVAMGDPLDPEAIEAAQTATGCRIIPVVADPVALDEWIARCYGLE
jgi:hypothetical protein